jgi:small conductance mechanosensitive channel
MRSRAYIALSALLVLAAFTSLSPVVADEEAEKRSAALTTADPEIPVEELELILKAFTKEELLVKADGWQKLLRAKVVEIGTPRLRSSARTGREP